MEVASLGKEIKLALTESKIIGEEAADVAKESELLSLNKGATLANKVNEEALIEAFGSEIDGGRDLHTIDASNTSWQNTRKLVAQSVATDEAKVQETIGKTFSDMTPKTQVQVPRAETLIAELGEHGIHCSASTAEMLLTFRVEQHGTIDELRQSVAHLLENATKNDATFATSLAKIFKTAKYSSLAVVLIYASYKVANYIHEHSGPFVVLASQQRLKPIEGNKQLSPAALRRYRIKSPYPCGFANKSGDVNHPLDDEIRIASPVVCENWQAYDMCGGWTRVDENSRLMQSLYAITPKDSNSRASLHSKIQAKLSNVVNISCENATVADALKKFSRDAVDAAENIISNILPSFISKRMTITFIASTFIFAILRVLFKMSTLFALIVTIILSIVVYVSFVRIEGILKNTSSSSKESSTIAPKAYARGASNAKSVRFLI